MKRYLILGTLLSLAACPAQPREEEPAVQPGAEPAPTEAPAPELRDEGPPEHLMFRPDEVEWQDAPPSLEPGAGIAVLEGDPGEAGVFTLRLRLPDGYVIAPHWHPNVERVTVLSGTFRLGKGEQVDPAATEALGPGSYTSIPPRTTHYAIAEGETVVQLTSVGPWELNYVNPEDDPRQR